MKNEFIRIERLDAWNDICEVDFGELIYSKIESHNFVMNMEQKWLKWIDSMSDKLEKKMLLGIELLVEFDSIKFCWFIQKNSQSLFFQYFFK